MKMSGTLDLNKNTTLPTNMKIARNYFLLKLFVSDVETAECEQTSTVVIFWSFGSYLPIFGKL